HRGAVRRAGRHEHRCRLVRPQPVQGSDDDHVDGDHDHGAAGDDDDLVDDNYGGADDYHVDDLDDGDVDHHHDHYDDLDDRDVDHHHDDYEHHDNIDYDHDDHEHDHDDSTAVQLRWRGAVEGLVHDRGRLGHLWPSRLGHEPGLLVAQLRRALLRRSGCGRAAAVDRPRPGDVLQQSSVHGDDRHPEWHVADRGGRQPLLGRLESPQRLHDGRRLPGRHVQVPAVHERGLPVRPAAADPEPLPPGRGHQQLRHQLDHGQCRGDGRLL